MPHQLEVCIDNIESLNQAIIGGATRIELCAALALGGLTPSYGFMQQACRNENVPVYVMIRPREGDFIYSPDEIVIMEADIAMAAKAGADGVVLGALTPQGNVDNATMQTLMRAAKQHHLPVTFHRAIDQCQDLTLALEHIIALGCERVLTSGQAVSAEQGVATIARMVQQANRRIQVMAGAGIHADNARYILTHSGVQELHLSAKTTRRSEMQRHNKAIAMGSDKFDESVITIPNAKRLQRIIAILTDAEKVQ